MPDRSTDETNPAIHLIFAEVSGKPVTEWEAFLDGACGGDSAMRAQLERMLAEFEGEEDEDQKQEEDRGDGLPGWIGNYKVIRQLGRGGMGVVYLARDPELEREVAIKLLEFGTRPHPDAVARFSREMKAVARLSHSNIATAYHAGEENGDRYLVMEYVEGSDLAKRVAESGPVSPETAVEWILQAARGLQHAHEAGIVHRDVKPANLLLDSKGTVKVLDLGLARLEAVEAEADGLTRSGTVMGTPDFMAPEQASETKEADQRADIYSLGCTLYFLLTGRPAFEGDTAFLKIQSHLEKPIPKLPGDHSSLGAVFRKMMAKIPDDRYQTMAEAVEALEACRRAFGTGDETNQKGGRKAAWIAAGAIVLAIGVGTLLWKPPIPPIPTVDADGLPLKRAPVGGSGDFTDTGQRLGNQYTTEVKLGDLDGDGDLDAVAANYKNAGSRVWLNDGRGNFTSGMTLGHGMATSVDLGDLDRDGDLDAVFADRNAVDRVWLNEGNEKFVEWGEGMLTPHARNVTLGDLDGDGLLDAVISQGGTGSVEANSVWFGDGAGNFVISEQRLGQEATWEAGLGDLDGDGDLDLVFANGDSRGTKEIVGPNTVWLNDGSGQFDDTGQRLGNSHSRDVVLGDLDGDGDLDAVFANAAGEVSEIWFNDGRAGFSRSDQVPGPRIDRGVILPDLDGDGDLDLVLFGDEAVNLRMLNDGSGNFSDPVSFGPNIYSGVGDAGDLDGDGDWDLFLPAINEPPNQVWLNQGVPEASADASEGNKAARSVGLIP